MRGLFGAADRDGLRLLGSRLAEVQQVLQRLGCGIEAVQVAHDAVTFRRALADADAGAGAGAGDDAADLAASLNALGSALADLDRRAQAAAVAQEEVALRRALAQGGRAHRRHQLANSLRDQGRWLGRGGGDAQHAARLMHDAMAILGALADGGSTAARFDLARTNLALATLLGDRGRAAEAVTWASRALAVYRECAGTDALRVEPELAKGLHNISIWLSQLGRASDALGAANEAAALFRSLAQRGSTDALRDWTWSLVTLGKRLAEMRSDDQAQRAYREAAALILRLPAHDAALWTWLASGPVATLALPQDLREFHLPLLRRLADMESTGSPGTAEALDRLQAQVAARVRSLLLALPVAQEELLDAGVVALLEPSCGAAAARWARSHTTGRRLLASSGAWAAQRRRIDR